MTVNPLLLALRLSLLITWTELPGGVLTPIWNWTRLSVQVTIVAGTLFTERVPVMTPKCCPDISTAVMVSYCSTKIGLNPEITGGVGVAVAVGVSVTLGVLVG